MVQRSDPIDGLALIHVCLFLFSVRIFIRLRCACVQQTDRSMGISWRGHLRGCDRDNARKLKLIVWVERVNFIQAIGVSFRRPLQLSRIRYSHLPTTFGDAVFAVGLPLLSTMMCRATRLPSQWWYMCACDVLSHRCMLESKL